MTAWTDDELARIGAEEEELEVAFVRGDGTLSRPRIVWVVRRGDAVYVRSVNGPAAAWFRGARSRHEGHITAGGVERDVRFVDANSDLDGGLNDGLDAGYRAKYRRYSAATLDRITSQESRSTTMRLEPR
jgi:hypothetical protein